MNDTKLADLAVSILSQLPTPKVEAFSAMLRVVVTTSGVLNTTPLLVGEATGIVLLVALTGLDRTAAVSVLAMDQLLVGVAKLVVLATAALLAPLPDWMARAALGLIVLVICGWSRATRQGGDDERGDEQEPQEASPGSMHWAKRD